MLPSPNGPPLGWGGLAKGLLRDSPWGLPYPSPGTPESAGLPELSTAQGNPVPGPLPQVL